MERIDTGYRLSSGREFYANRGLVSIVRADGVFEICEGYDGDVYYQREDWNEHSNPWLPAECAELADHMIALWQAFKDSSAQRS